jgi:hypothetical protein
MHCCRFCEPVKDKASRIKKEIGPASFSQDEPDSEGVLAVAFKQVVMHRMSSLRSSPRVLRKTTSSSTSANLGRMKSKDGFQLALNARMTTKAYQELTWVPA